ncbi:hypothetical protein [Streptomyces sp. NPDC097619]|uniref:hypothetical protein n=1 Tax=Streptomyces sp. NPDC097619 TaxID=3157228 RepID=UPI00331BB69E
MRGEFRGEAVQDRFGVAGRLELCPAPREFEENAGAPVVAEGSQDLQGAFPADQGGGADGGRGLRFGEAAGSGQEF